MTRNLAKLYPGKIGCCVQPNSWLGKDWMPYFIDNGAFSDHRQGRPFREEAFKSLLYKATDLYSREGILPDFVVVPDRFNDPEQTAKLWERWATEIKAISPLFKLAYVAQPKADGGFPDVPSNAELIFTGGDKPWKFAAVLAYKELGLPIHVGGITASKLYWCHLQGATSGDSAGFFRGDMIQLQKLYNYLADAAGEISPLNAPPSTRRRNDQPTLF